MLNVCLELLEAVMSLRKSHYLTFGIVLVMHSSLIFSLLIPNIFNVVTKLLNFERERNRYDSIYNQIYIINYVVC